MAVMRISKVFRKICGSVWNPLELDALQADVTRSMTLLEIRFPPSFFDIMTHLLYHLVDELDMCGHVFTRWMYPIERYMKTLKHYIRNMAAPEACMAEGYARDECLGFITEYLHKFEVVDRRVWDANEEYEDTEEVLEGAWTKYLMTPTLRDGAHQYALTNVSFMAPLHRWVWPCFLWLHILVSMCPVLLQKMNVTVNNYCLTKRMRHIWLVNDS